MCRTLLTNTDLEQPLVAVLLATYNGSSFLAEKRNRVRLDIWVFATKSEVKNKGGIKLPE